jgi:Mn2+/Fe2+ NRAMP family transporter
MIYLGSIWSRVPAIVPVHFGFGGTPDRYASRITLWSISGVMAVVSLVSYFLFDILYHKGKNGPYSPPRFLPVLGTALLIVISGINLFAITECALYPGNK